LGAIKIDARPNVPFWMARVSDLKAEFEKNEVLLFFGVAEIIEAYLSST